MPPRINSRHTFTNGVADSKGKLHLTERKPFRFQQRSDNRSHTVEEGDSLFTVAARHFQSFERPAGLWWIVADYQPTPILDPTIKLSPGRVLVVPAERLVIEEIFNEDRRVEA